VLRRRLVLAWFGAVLAGATIGTGVAKAAPDVCATLQTSPTVGAVEQLVAGFMADGFTPNDAGEILAVTVLNRCPQYAPVLERFIRAYTTPGGAVQA
jgi:hypothetical protein